MILNIDTKSKPFARIGRIKLQELIKYDILLRVINKKGKVYYNDYVEVQKNTKNTSPLPHHLGDYHNTHPVDPHSFIYIFT